MSYVDLNTIHNPATGTVPPVSWGDQIRTNFEWLVAPDQFDLYGLATTTGSAVFTDLDVRNEIYDTAAMHAGTNKYVTIQTAGHWELQVTVNWTDTAHTGGARVIQLWKNATTAMQLSAIAPAGALANTVQSGARSLILAVGDTIGVQAWQSSGFNTDCFVADFSGRWIGR